MLVLSGAPGCTEEDDAEVTALDADSVTLADTAPVAVAATPVELRPEQLPAILSLREQLGFEADHEFVADLYAHPEQYDARTSARDDLLGLVLTPDEVAQMRTRNRLEHHAAVLERWGRDNVPDTFAGLHIAAAANGGGAIVKVLFAGSPTTPSSTARSSPSCSPRN